MSLWSFVIPGLSVLELPSGNHCPISSHCDLWPVTFDLVTSKSIVGHLLVKTNVPMKLHDPRRKRSWVIIRKPFSYFQSTILLLQVTVTLTFDLVIWKSIGVICRSWPMSLWSFIIPGICVLVSYHPETIFLFPVTVTLTCDIDIQPSDLKINRGHLTVMTNVAMKFHDPRRKRSWVIIPKPFSFLQSTILLLQVTVTLTFDLVTWKSIGVICRSWPMSLWSFMIPGVSVLELSSGNHFPISSQCDLDLWPWPLT